MKINHDHPLGRVLQVLLDGEDITRIRRVLSADPEMGTIEVIVERTRQGVIPGTLHGKVQFKIDPADVPYAETVPSRFYKEIEPYLVKE